MLRRHLLETQSQDGKNIKEKPSGIHRRPEEFEKFRSPSSRAHQTAVDLSCSMYTKGP